MAYSGSKWRYEFERVEGALAEAKRAARSLDDASSDDAKERAVGAIRREIDWAGEHLRILMREGF